MFFFKNKGLKSIHKPKIWLYADMEGINNITRWDEVNPACAAFKVGSQLMTEEVNSVVLGLFKAGAKEVFINDLHWFYNNLIWERIDKRATDYCGVSLNVSTFLTEDFDAVAIVGMHAKAGAVDAFLPHSWYLSSYIHSMEFNQKFIGEIELIKFLAEEKGVPVIFMSGDRAGCLEAKDSISGICTAVTKEKHWGKVSLLSRKEANKLVYRKAGASVKQLLKNKDTLKKRVLKSEPMDITFASRRLSETIQSRCVSKGFDYEVVGERTVRFKGKRFSETLQHFMSVLD